MAKLKAGMAALVALLGGLTTAGQAGDFIIVSNGGAQCTIVVPVTNKSDDSWFGACELTNHIFQMTGVMVPVALETNVVTGPMILVGKSKNRLVQLDPSSNLYYSGFQPQEYQIWFTNGSVSLYGSENIGGPAPEPTWPNLNWVPDQTLDEHGTLYAVYEFLETYCGVHWYHPGRWGTTLSTTNVLKVSATNLRRKPALDYRGLPSYYNLQEQVALDGWTNNTSLRLTSEERRIWELRNKGGGLSQNMGHSFRYYHLYYSTTEWFARDVNNNSLGSKPCFSSTGLLAQVVADITNYYATGQNPHGLTFNGDLVNLTPEDGWGYCKCTNCIPVDWPNNQGWMSCGEVSRTFWWFADNVASQINLMLPGKKVGALAYQSYYNYPSNYTIQSTNMVVGMCPFYNRFWVPGIEANAYYANEQAQITNWGTQFDGLLTGMWTYPCYPNEGAERGDYNCFPGFFAHEHVDQLRLFESVGNRGVFNLGGGELVDTYVLTKFMDYSSADLDQFLTNMFANYYGPAAAPMRTMYQEMETAYTAMSTYSNGGFSTAENVAWDYVGSTPRMLQWSNQLVQAKALAISDPYATRVRLFENSIWKFMTDGKRRWETDKLNTAPSRTNKAPDVVVYKSPVSYGGNITNVDWNQVKPLSINRGIYGYATERQADLRVVHDGSYIYIRIIEDVRGQFISAAGFRWGDAWEIYYSHAPGTYTAYQAYQADGIMSDSSRASMQRSDSQWILYDRVPISSVLGQSWTTNAIAYMNFQRGGSQGNECMHYSPTLSAGWYHFGDHQRHGKFTLAGDYVPVSMHVNVSNATPVSPYTNWATAATSIQDAVDIALAGDFIYVAPGMYGANTRPADLTNQVRATVAVNLVASGTPANTLINGNGSRRCIWLEAVGSSIRGFTFTNGVSDSGSGFLGNANLENCVAARNIATNGHGGGFIVGSGSIRNCLAVNNIATNASNSRDGGGFYLGGLGAGGYVIENCTAVGNYAGRDGGGIYMDNRALTNVAVNCIVYGNVGTASTLDIEYGKGSEPVTMAYSCAGNLGAGSNGNITNNPAFLAGGYQLSSNSPCVNAGSNSVWMLSAGDLLGNPRIQSGTVDMGAYESSSAVVPPALVSLPIAVIEDDMEEFGTNMAMTGSSDLEFCYDGASQQKVGMRFINVPIPQGATIVSAAIQFMTDETNDVATSLTIRGEKVGNSAAFIYTNGNISARSLTTASVGWNPPGWYTLQEAGAAQRTPDLSSIVQEIVNQGAWASNNAMTFVVNGTGTRTAEARESMTNGVTPPTLVIEWNLSGGGQTDGDADGMPDAWEQTYFGGTSSTNGGAMQDADADGLPNQYEYIAGTDPTNWGSQFEVLNTTNSSTPWVIRWNSASNRAYAVFHRTNLTGGTWVTLTNGMPSAYPAQNVYTDTLHTAGPGGYYKIRVALP